MSERAVLQFRFELQADTGRRERVLGIEPTMTFGTAPPGLDNATTEQVLQQALVHQRAGRFQEAARLYQTIVQREPNCAAAHYGLGVIEVRLQRPHAGLHHLKAALSANPNEGQHWLSLIDALIQTDQRDVAQQLLATARQHGLMGEPVDALAWRLQAPREDNLLSRVKQDEQVWWSKAVAHAQQGRLAEADACYSHIPAHSPIAHLALTERGALAAKQQRFEVAATFLRAALAVKPEHVDALSNLGNALRALGQLEPALESCTKALQLNPYHQGALTNCAAVLLALGRFDDAEVCCRKALCLQPEALDALDNLGIVLLAKGDCMGALGIVLQSLRSDASATDKHLFVEAVKGLHFMRDDLELRAVLTRALSEAWVRPVELLGVATSLVKVGQHTAAAIERAVQAWPESLPSASLLSPADASNSGGDFLLLAVLGAAPIADVPLERFLTLLRRSLLASAAEPHAAEAPDPSAIALYCALASQCFINEYVFVSTDVEATQADLLRQALQSALQADEPVPVLTVLAVAAYFPLHGVPAAEALLDRAWPDLVRSLLVQQLREPAEERTLRATIPQLTSIDSEVSRQVQAQYEESPYPRWIKAPPAPELTGIDVYLHRLLPSAVFRPLGKLCDAEILIAGCGTGQQAIDAARTYAGQMLAVDLSLASLAYAKRKTIELGISSIEYAQADLLKLSSLGRSFDVIESVGVLHHLADPFAGWRELLCLLRPHGFMRIGLYSELARRDIVRARQYIAEQGYAATAEGIRKHRQDLLKQHALVEFGFAVASADFFSTSTCRDLLFHVQERRFTLPAIAGFLEANALRLLGFSLDPRTLNAYRQRFPDDPSATNLKYWHAFETDHPDTFLGMYQFWIQKVG